MTKTMVQWFLVMLGLALSACASDDNGSGGGNGDDTLPKRGERDTDPTIVSASAQCYTDSPKPLEVHVVGTDPLGVANLGSCSGSVVGNTDEDGFGENDDCYLSFTMSPCTVGDVITVGLTVSNDTGGVTTASVKVTIHD